MRAARGEIELETIVERIRREELDLQPNFQRGEIWDLKRKQRLIDTILRQWYVPAVHLVRDGDHREIVLDGQQRLATIRDFFEDKIPVLGTIEPPSDYLAALDGLTFSQLPDGIRRAVRRFMLPVVTLTDFLPNEPNELFFRLNQSYNLTPPEKRNALHGVARDQVKTLVSEMEAAGILSQERIGFSNGRLAYDDIIARTCVAIEIDNLRRHINNTVVEEFYRTGEFSTSTMEGLENAAGSLRQQVQEAGGKVKFNKGTLQTWLLYLFCVQREQGHVPPTLLAAFEYARAEVKRGTLPGNDETSAEILAIYTDRASYRVTDVSSVLARDLAIHLFSLRMYDTKSRRNSSGLLGHLVADRPSDAKVAFFNFLDESQWGNPLLDV